MSAFPRPTSTMTTCAPFGSTCPDPAPDLAFEHLFDYRRGMLPTDLDAARDLLQKAVDAVRDGGVLGDSELRDALALTRELTRLVSQVQVETVAALDRSGAFAAEGYKRPDSAVANLLTVDRGRAAEITRAAARVCPRVDPQGQVLPVSLPATAAGVA